MTRYFFLLFSLLFVQAVSAKNPADVFPDGTPVDAWFKQQPTTDLSQLGTAYVLTEHGVVLDSTMVQTVAIQSVIDKAAKQGGGVVVVPEGTYLTGALFMRQGVNLYLEAGAKIKGSDDISNFPVLETRIEGQTCKYFAALINADSISGLRICGEGTIDGNGLRYWQAFWLRRSWNPQCTNKDEQRPRLVYISNCSDVELTGLRLQNSPFWTTHIYRSNHVRLTNLRITSPAAPVKAPSTDAVDIDACTDVHISHCYMAVNDDAIALKGGKGPWADKDKNNGANERIIVEDCEYGFCHSCITCGSESIHNRNVILRRIKVGQATRLLWLKMRPDTPQHYEYITVEDIQGEVSNFIFIHPWTQFFDLQGRTDMPLSRAHNITMRRCQIRCKTFFNVAASDQYSLSDFTFADLDIQAVNPDCDASLVKNFTQKKVKVERYDPTTRFVETNEKGEILTK